MDKVKQFIGKLQMPIKITIGIIFALLLSNILSAAFTVHHVDVPNEYWNSVPGIKEKLLDGSFFMGFMTVALIFWVFVFAKLYWYLHSLPKKHAAQTGQPRLIFWLCMLGIIYNPLWLAAILIVVTDWELITKSLTRIFGGTKS